MEGTRTMTVDLVLGIRRKSKNFHVGERNELFFSEKFGFFVWIDSGPGM